MKPSDLLGRALASDDNILFAGNAFYLAAVFKRLQTTCRAYVTLDLRDGDLNKTLGVLKDAELPWTSALVILLGQTLSSDLHCAFSDWVQERQQLARKRGLRLFVLAAGKPGKSLSQLFPFQLPMEAALW